MQSNLLMEDSFEEDLTKGTDKENDYYICQFCTYTTNRLVSFTNHVAKCTENTRNSADQYNNFNCTKCGFVSSDFTVFDEHCKSHLSTTLYKCIDCTFICVGSQEFNSHVKHEHTDNEHSCKRVKYNSNQQEAVIINESVKKRTVVEEDEDSVNSTTYEFDCKECSFYSHSSEKYERHMNLHSIVRTYNCSLCQHKIASYDLFTSHINNFHPEILQPESDSDEIAADEQFTVKTEPQFRTPAQELKKIKCLYCLYTTDWRCSFQKHMVKEHPHKSVYKCDMCAYEAMHGKTMKAHKFNAHGVGESTKVKEDAVPTKPEEPQDEILECRWCPYETVWLTTYRKHIINRHPGKNIFHCKMCGFETNQKMSMTKHMKDTHLDLIEEFQCQLCDFKSNSKAGLGNHIFAMHGPKSEPQCQPKSEPLSKPSSPISEVAATIFQLSEVSAPHPKKDKHPKQHKCSLCLYQTNGLILYERHLRAHSERVAYHCKLCPYKSIMRNLLVKHMRGSHSREKEHFWRVVKRGTPEEEDECILEIGPVSRTFKCELCEFETNVPAHFDSHKRAHDSTVSHRCQVCPYLTQSRYSLGCHMKRQHPGDVYNPPPVFRASLKGIRKGIRRKVRIPITTHTSTCEKCGYVAKNILTFRNHVTAHTSSYNYACRYCLYLNTCYASFRWHMHRYHPNETIEVKRNPLESHKYQCDQCEYGSNLIQNIEAHKKHHENSSSYVCDSCNYITISMIKLTKHKKRSHPELCRKRCPHCEYTTNRKTNFRAHLWAHKDPKAYDCEYCPYKSSSYNPLTNHMAYSHPGLPNNVKKHQIEESEEEIESEMLKCDQCPFTCKNINFLLSHNRAHSNENCLKCEDCHFITTFEHSLRKHREDKHSAGKRVHKCTECEYTTKRYTYLKNHMKAHQSLYSYDCIHCPYKTVKYSLYVCHMQYRHSEENIDQEEHEIPEEEEDKPRTAVEMFKCPECSYQSKRKEFVDAHIKAHSNEKSIKCDLCDFICLSKSNMRTHLSLKHPESELRATMYKCTKCEFAAGSAVMLKSHTRAHNSVYSYDCKHCPYKTVFYNSVQKHYTKQHPEKVFDLEKVVEREGYDPVKPKTSFYYCDYCIFRTIYYKRYCNHISLLHPGQSNGYEEYESSKNETKEVFQLVMYQCRVCQYKSEDTSKVEEHFGTHPPLIHYVCDYCSHQSVSQATFDAHMMQCHPELPNRHNWAFQCLFCHFQTNDGEAFKSHTHTFEEKTTVGSGGKQKIVKTENLALMCDECGFNAINIIRLKHHMKAHVSGVKSFTCTLCKFKSVIRQSFRRHMKNFHGVEVEKLVRGGASSTGRPPKTEDDSLKTEDSSSVSGDVPHSPKNASIPNHPMKLLKEGKAVNARYKCNECGYDATSIVSYASHMAAHTSTTAFSCKKCLYRTVKYVNFKSHMQRHHPKSKQLSHPPAPRVTSISSQAVFFTSIKEEPASPNSEGSLGEIDWSQMDEEDEVMDMEVKMEYSEEL